MYRSGDRRMSQSPMAQKIFPATSLGLRAMADRLKFAGLELLAKEVDLFSNSGIFLHSLFNAVNGV
jgi:hypothetical protein